MLRWHRFGEDAQPLCGNHSMLAGHRRIGWTAFVVEAVEHDARGWAKKSA